jgi:hypothetical protein
MPAQHAVYGGGATCTGCGIVYAAEALPRADGRCSKCPPAEPTEGELTIARIREQLSIETEPEPKPRHFSQTNWLD